MPHYYLLLWHVKGESTLEFISTCPAVPRSPGIRQRHALHGHGLERKHWASHCFPEQPEKLCGYLLSFTFIRLICWSSCEVGRQEEEKLVLRHQ